MDLLESLDVPFDTVLIRRLLRCSLAWARVARKEREQMRSIFALGARPARPGIDQLLSSSGRGAGPGGRAAGGVGETTLAIALPACLLPSYRHIFVVGGS